MNFDPDHTHLTGSIEDDRLTILANALFLLFFSQPVTLGRTEEEKHSYMYTCILKFHLQWNLSNPIFKESVLIGEVS